MRVVQAPVRDGDIMRPPPPGTAVKRRAVRRNLTAHAFLLPFLCVFVVGVLAPLMYSVNLSLYQERMIGGMVFTGLDNYTKAFKDNLFHMRPRPRRTLLRDPGTAHARPRTVGRPRDRQWPAARAGALPDRHLRPLRRSRCGRGTDVGLPVRGPLRPGRRDRRPLAHRGARPALRELDARFDRQHRHVVVRRLQHADLLRGTAIGARGAVRGGRGRRRRLPSARRSASNCRPCALPC